MVRAVPAVAVVMVLATFAWHPAGLPQAFAQQDKLAHLLGFAALSLTLRLGLPDLSRQEYGGALLLAASAMELGQTFVPTRTGSLGDLAADAVGAVLGFALADAWRQWHWAVTVGASATVALGCVPDTKDPHTRAAGFNAADGERRRCDEAPASSPKDEPR
jgi:serine/threonine protein kinase HipA of HipAB toxin-antitoxin module